MPGKINPVIPEAVLQVCMQVCGNDATIAMAGQSGAFELNVALPVIAHNLLESIDLLTKAAVVFSDKCIRNIQANRRICNSYIEKSLALATALVPHIGYDRAAEVAKKAYASGERVADVARKEHLLPEALLGDLFGD
jgi:fumarate hydratase class II